MAKAVYVGIGGKARKVKKIYVGIGGKARKVKKAYVGIGGKARLCFSSGAEKGLYWLFRNGENTVCKLDPTTGSILSTVTMVTDGTFGRNANFGWGSAEAFGSLINYGINAGTSPSVDYNCAVQKTDPQSGSKIARLIDYIARSPTDSVGANPSEILLCASNNYSNPKAYLKVYNPTSGSLIRDLISSTNNIAVNNVRICGSAAGKFIRRFTGGSSDEDLHSADEYNSLTNGFVRTIYHGTTYYDDYDVLDDVIFKEYQLAGGIWDNKMYLWRMNYSSLAVLTKLELSTTANGTSICTVKG